MAAFKILEFFLLLFLDTLFQKFEIFFVGFVLSYKADITNMIYIKRFLALIG